MKGSQESIRKMYGLNSKFWFLYVNTCGDLIFVTNLLYSEQIKHVTTYNTLFFI